MCENCCYPDRWVSVNNSLPQHHDIVLVCSKKGIGVATFVDSIEMNKTLDKTGYGNEKVDVKKHPYFFVSQEIRQHTFNDVTHWMYLPRKPYE